MEYSYRTAIAETLREYAQLRRRTSSVHTIAICDTATDNYLLVNLGWTDDERIHNIVIHLRIIDRQIHIEWNGTDTLIEDLIDRGIPKSDFISAIARERTKPNPYMSQHDRPLTEA
ncbi:MAG: element excision factor XisI family protein [Geitlerinemataceae cyanobacterium]